MFDDDDDTDDILFDRGGFVESLAPQLRAAIFSTYTLKLDDLQAEMPSLFSDSSIPTLVLHGNSGLDGMDSEIKETSHSLYEWNEFRSRRGGRRRKKRARLPPSVSIAEVVPRAQIKHAQGVHHPKYALLFLENEVIFVVSTSNLVQQLSVDVSWTQRFKRRRQRGVTEFGTILDDFLAKQGDDLEASAFLKGKNCKDLRPHKWLQDVLGVT
ncbi:MAG: hypothetical protein AAFQ67_02785, partial [Pseudomonadota bacterium]